jgi:hypothetical protein
MEREYAQCGCHRQPPCARARAYVCTHPLPRAPPRAARRWRRDGSPRGSGPRAAPSAGGWPACGGGEQRPRHRSKRTDLLVEACWARLGCQVATPGPHLRRPLLRANEKLRRGGLEAGPASLALQRHQLQACACTHHCKGLRRWPLASQAAVWVAEQALPLVPHPVTRQAWIDSNRADWVLRPGPNSLHATRLCALLCGSH